MKFVSQVDDGDPLFIHDISHWSSQPYFTGEDPRILKLTGAVDVPASKREIAEVMEGGVDVFKLRHQKYGF